MAATTVAREYSVTTDLIPPLDPSRFKPTLQELEFLKSTISDDEDIIRERVLEVQQEAYQQYPYPCIRAFHHISLMMCANKVYAQVIESGKENGCFFLDLGCCMGTDVRKLVADGYPANHVIACDLRSTFIDLGLDKLYRDRGTSQITFFAGDIFDFTPRAPHRPQTPPATEKPLSECSSFDDVVGKISHLYSGALFHLFVKDTQLALAQRLAHILKREKGSVIFGRHQGKQEEGYLDDGMMKRARYGHSPDSFKKLWQDVFRALEGEDFVREHVVVDAELGNAITPGREDTIMWWSVVII